jgi:hypothetical protein
VTHMLLRQVEAGVQGLDMTVEIAAVVEGLVTDAALEGSRARVDPLVYDQVLPAAEQLTAHAAHLNNRPTHAG